tara:strand:+ start:64 stop:237 length:174 start_codon:yes stop_codon:yes gene_type:complete
MRKGIDRSHKKAKVEEAPKPVVKVEETPKQVEKIVEITTNPVSTPKKKVTRTKGSTK